MTNPHPTDATDIDIRAVADRVIAQMRQAQPDQALHLLETERQGERRVVREALDRYVSVGARAQIDEIHQSGGLRSPEFVPALERLRQAGLPPRVPDYNGREINEPNELVGDHCAEVRRLCQHRGDARKPGGIGCTAERGERAAWVAQGNIHVGLDG